MNPVSLELHYSHSMKLNFPRATQSHIHSDTLNDLYFLNNR